jgi:hypothetical protein
VIALKKEDGEVDIVREVREGERIGADTDVRERERPNLLGHRLAWRL